MRVLRPMGPGSPARLRWPMVLAVALLTAGFLLSLSFLHSSTDPTRPAEEDSVRFRYIASLYLKYVIFIAWFDAMSGHSSPKSWVCIRLSLSGPFFSNLCKDIRTATGANILSLEKHGNYQKADVKSPIFMELSGRMYGRLERASAIVNCRSISIIISVTVLCDDTETCESTAKSSRLQSA